MINLGMHLPKDKLNAVYLWIQQNHTSAQNSSIKCKNTIYQNNWLYVEKDIDYYYLQQTTSKKMTQSWSMFSRMLSNLTGYENRAHTVPTQIRRSPLSINVSLIQTIVLTTLATIPGCCVLMVRTHWKMSTIPSTFSFSS